MKNLIKIHLMFFLLCPGGAWASISNDGKFTLKEALDYAHEYNPDIQHAKEKIEQLDHSYYHSISTAFPEIDFNSSYKRYTTATTTTSSGTRDPLESYDASISATQTIFNGGKISATISKARLNRELAILDQELTEQNVNYDVIKNYYSTVLLNEKLYTLNRSSELESQLLKLVQNKFKVGIATEYDVLKIKVLLNNIEPQILDIDAKINEARFKINLLLGRDPKAPFEVQDTLHIDKRDIDPLKTGPFENHLKMAQTHRPDLKKNSRQEEILSRERTIDMSPYWPTITATGKMGQTNKDSNRLFDDSSNEWSLGASLKIPLFSGFGSIAKSNEYSSKKKLNSIEKSQLQDQIASELKTALAELDKSKNKLEMSQKAAKDAGQAFKLAQKLYKAGRLATLDLVSSERDSLDSQFYFLQAKYDYYMASVDFKKAEGLDITRK